MKILTNQSRNNPVIIAMMFLIISLFTGCTGMHLHRAEDNALAKQAVGQYDSAQVLQAIETESKNLDKMLESELLVVDRLVDISLQREWLRLIRDPAPLAESLLQKVIGKRKQALGLDHFTSEEITGIIRLEAELQLIDQQILDSSFIAESMFRVNFPPCSALPATDQLPESLLKRARRNNPNRNPAIVLSPLYHDHLRKCSERRLLIDTTLEPFTNPAQAAIDPQGTTAKQGLIAQSLADWQRAQAQLESEKSRSNELRKTYDELSDKIDTAFKNRAELDESSTHEELEKLSGQLRTALELVSADAGAFGLADASFERIEHIDSLLSAIVNNAIGQSSFDSASTYRSASVTAGLLSVKAEVERLLSKQSLEPIAGLIIEKQRQLALRKLALDRISRQQQRVQLLHDRYQTIVDELEILRSIEVSANQEDVDELLQNSARELLSMRCNNITCGEIQRIFLKYIASVDHAQRRLQHIDYHLIDLEHRAALEESATAVRLWHALIETPLKELAAYHASGLKSEALADLFVRFSTLGSIAVGVNN